MAEEQREFNTDQFAEFFKNYLLQNKILTNETLKLQNTITELLSVIMAYGLIIGGLQYFNCITSIYSNI